MKDVLRIGGRLAVICAVAATILGGINALTEPRIEWIQQQRLDAALQNVSRGNKTGEMVTVEDSKVVKAYYPIIAENSKDVSGYVLRLVGQGYGGDMVILAGIAKNGEVFSAELMQNQETPGLGKEAEKQEYMKKYTGKGEEDMIPVRKDMLSQEQADSITGATITFIGIGKALAEGSDFVKNMEG
jgi:Na+-translocating ferredoxin:NAD+ oxidoreductase subunit G